LRKWNSEPRGAYRRCSTFQVVGHPRAILQGVDLVDAVEFRRPVVRDGGSPASFFDSGKPVAGFTALDPPDLGPLNFAALAASAAGTWARGPRRSKRSGKESRPGHRRQNRPRRSLFTSVGLSAAVFPPRPPHRTIQSGRPFACDMLACCNVPTGAGISWAIPRVVRTRGRADHDGLHARIESWWWRGPQPARRFAESHLQRERRDYADRPVGLKPGEES